MWSSLSNKENNLNTLYYGNTGKQDRENKGTSHFYWKRLQKAFGQSITKGTSYK